MIQIFQTLAEMPWLALTTIATLGSTGLLVRSVNYMGRYTTALVGLAIVAALAAVTFLSILGSSRGITDL